MDKNVLEKVAQAARQLDKRLGYTIEKLAEDLQKSFPGISGFSRRNIVRMQAFFIVYELVPQPVALITDLAIKDSLIAEYALQDINKPIGVADYAAHIVEKLPKNLKRNLPSIEEIEAELAKQEMLDKKQVSPKKSGKRRGPLTK